MPRTDSWIWVAIYDQGILVEEEQIPLEDVQALEDKYAYDGYEVRRGATC